MTGRVLGFEVIRRKNGNGFASAVSAFVPSPDRAMGGAGGPFRGAVRRGYALFSRYRFALFGAVFGSSFWGSGMGDACTDPFGCPFPFFRRPVVDNFVDND